MVRATSSWNTSLNSISATARRSRLQRRGVQVLELFLVLPILLMVTLGIVQFGYVSLVHQTVVTAATEGGRRAAQGGGVDDVAAAVQDILATHRLKIASAEEGGNVLLMLEDGDDNSTESTGRVDLPCEPPAIPLQAGEVRVTLCLQASDSNGRPIPDRLGGFGLSFGNRRLEVSSLARKD